jgi:class 3 adenylate cyclase
MERKEICTTENHLISVYDIENYVQITKKLSTSELFDLMAQIQTVTIETILDCKPMVIKNIGDANLMIFNSEDIDLKINALNELKNKIEDLLKDKGFSTKVSFSSHFGEISVGKIGIEPFRQMDAFGEELNRTFLLNGKPYRGRFTISPELFRKLNGVTRKKYHKFTPQIMYTAE